MTLVAPKRALLSVSDKRGLLPFVKGLVELGIELISTGGTRRTLEEAGIPVQDIAAVTGFPEILDGRVKTLHPKIHGGILARRDDPEHQATLHRHDISPIDLVVCNLYPFRETLAKAGSTHAEIVENIDIGGPSMIRSAAKNFQHVAVVTHPEQYPRVLQELTAGQGQLTLELRAELAAAAFTHTCAYDHAIASYLGGRLQTADAWPVFEHLSFRRKQELRYGENPHQKAAFYVEPEVRHPCVASAEVLHGKELSYNNILDLDSALNLVREFAGPAVVVVKHNNPCGAATAAELAEAFHRAYEGDPVSAFGGILGFNRTVDVATASRIAEPGRFIECLIAPDITPEAFEILTTKPTWKKNVRILKTGPLKDGPGPSLDFRRVDGGLLLQGRDLPADDFAQAKVVTRRKPTDQELADLKFAWLVAKHVKSNAIVLAAEGRVVGVGAGQMSRVDSTHMAVRKAGDRAPGSVLASDAFFPFRDNIDEAARAGIRAVVQPGGSVRDQDSIAACDEHDIAMLCTGIRHFRH